MHRTTIMIPSGLEVKTKREAEKEGISFGELVRRALERYILSKKDKVSHDSFLSSGTLFDDQGPSDVAARHDDYLTKQNIHDKS